MKIVELRLSAFGRFTDATLDLSGSGGGLHIVYGPNEAGKSTALRALRSFFFGIDVRSDDNFVHPYGEMRIGAALRHSDGQELNATRRKGVKKTLLDDSDTDVEGLIQSKFLGGVGRELYEQQFGIDYDGLVRGGEDLLKGGGSVGESLFAAGLGGAGIQDVLASLDTEMESLFVPRGRTRALNIAISEYREEKKKIGEVELRSSVWQDAKAALEGTTAEVTELGAELAGLDRDRARLDRLRLALPLIAVRKAVLAELVELRDAVPLPDGFGDERVRLMRDRDAAKGAIDEADADLRRLDAAIAKLSVPERIVEQGEVIDGLHRRLGGHQKAQHDVVGLRASHTVAVSAATAVLKELRPELAWEDLDSLRLPQAQRVRIQNLGSQRQSLHDQRDAATERLAELTARIDRTRAELASQEAPADPRDLDAAIAQVSRSGDIEDDLAAARAEVSLAQEDLDARIRQLSLWDGAAEDLETLTAPSMEAVERFEDERAGIDARSERLTAREDRLKEQIAANRLQLDELRLAGAVPTEDDLTRGRETRDAGWGLIRAAWLDGVQDQAAVTEFAGEDPLPDAYEASVREADDTADRLRREADRVAKQAAHAAAVAKAESELQECAEEAERLDGERAGWAAGWAAEWEPIGVAPKPPREMRAWLLSLHGITQAAADLRRKRATVARLHDDVAGQKLGLSERLAGLGEATAAEGETLESLLGRAISVRDELRARADARTRLLEEVGSLEVEVESSGRAVAGAGQAVASWRANWSASIEGLGLRADATPEEANVVLEKLGTLAKHADEAASLEGRITGIDRDAGEFQSDVKTLVTRIAPELSDEPADRCVSLLHVLLRQAEEDAATLRQLRERRADALGEREESERAVGRATARLRAMCEEAACADEDGLKDAEERSRRKRAAQSDLEQNERQLLEHAGAGTLDDLLREAGAIDADTAPSELRDLDERAEALRVRQAELNRQIGGEQAALNAMDGSSEAAAAAERAAQLLARISAGAERYARLKVASTVLRREIERYREENQAPILRRAGEVFARLTLGSFASLATDYSQGDDPVLVGVRESGVRVNVEGMSDGSRDQLYLALRLAGLERRLETNEPLPLTVDDILVKFDDDRSRAALEALHELSESTQVIFFTHHEHLTTLAESAVGGPNLHIHRLSA